MTLLTIAVGAALGMLVWKRLGRLDRHVSLESEIGSRWLLYVGVAAIVTGVAYFERLAIDRGWIGETARVLQGGAAGLLLVAWGLRLARDGQRVYGQVLAGGGLGILYISTYAAFTLYALVGHAAAMAAMLSVTTLAAWLSERQASRILALVAVIGGFATPLLLPSSADPGLALFGYEIILVAGTMALATRRDWPVLNAVGFAFVVVTVLTWAAAHYMSSAYLAAELFLTVLCGLYAVALRQSAHSRDESARTVRAFLWLAPAAYYGASLAILAGHPAAFLIYLVLVSAVGIALAVHAGAWARVLVWLIAVAPMIVWSDTADEAWRAAGLATWAGVYLLHLLAHLFAGHRAGGRLATTELALLHLNGLVAYAGLHLLLQRAPDPIAATAAAGFGAWHGGLGVWRMMRHCRDGLHFVAVGFALLTIAAALHIDGAWLTSAWAAEGAAVVYLSLRERRDWLRAAGLTLFAVAVGRLLVLFDGPPPTPAVLVNARAACALFVITLTYLLAYAHHRHGDGERARLATGLSLVLAKLLTLGLAASEIVGYWTFAVPPPFTPAVQLVDAALVAGGVIVWLGLARREPWIEGVGGAIIALAGFSLLALQMEHAPVDYAAMFNGRAAAGLLAIVVLGGLAHLNARASGLQDGLRAVRTTVLTTAASLMGLSLLTSEINAIWTAPEDEAVTAAALQIMAWAGIGAFLAWRGFTPGWGWMRLVGGGLIVVAVLRLLDLQLSGVPASYVVIASARALSALVVIALLYGLAWRSRAREGGQTAAALVLTANILTLTMLTSEIAAHWRLAEASGGLARAAADGRFARELMISITWAAYATALVVAGLMRRYAPIRYFGMALFFVTTGKVFLIDLAALDQIYRVSSVIALGVALLVTSFLYNRVRVSAEAGASGAPSR